MSDERGSVDAPHGVVLEADEAALAPQAAAEPDSAAPEAALAPDATPASEAAPEHDVVPAQEAAPPVDLTGVRFPIDLPEYRGGLEQLVVRAQRGDIDLSTIPIATITSTFRRNARSQEKPDLREMADFLTLVSRLINLKAQAVLPDPSNAADAAEEEAVDGSDAGRRLAEYRLFKAAAEALLAEAAEEGARSFLGLVAADVVPVERLRIPPERLAAAFRAVLERLTQLEPLPIGTVTFPVDGMAQRIRERLAATGSLDFEAIFTGVGSRLEAVALFLGLLELLRNGEAVVEQEEALGPIVVRSVG